MVSHLSSLLRGQLPQSAAAMPEMQSSLEIVVFQCHRMDIFKDKCYSQIDPKYATGHDISTQDSKLIKFATYNNFQCYGIFGTFHWRSHNNLPRFRLPFSMIEYERLSGGTNIHNDS